MQASMNVSEKAAELIGDEVSEGVPCRALCTNGRPTIEVGDSQGGIHGHIWLHFPSVDRLRRFAAECIALADEAEQDTKAATLAQLDQQFAETPTEAEPVICPGCGIENPEATDDHPHHDECARNVLAAIDRADHQRQEQKERDMNPATA